MPIHYALRKQRTFTSADLYTARVTRLDAVEMRDLVDHIVARGSTVGRADILSVLEDYHSTVRDLLLMGMSVNTPTACYRPGIHGTFSGLEDSFDPARHRLVVRVRPGAALKEAIAKSARAAKEITEPRKPIPVQYLDLASGKANEVLTPGEGGHLTGRLLRFDPADPAQGVFFVAADGTAVRAERLLDVRSRKVVLLAPALPAGVYQLEVRASFNGNGDVRRGMLGSPLTVL